MRVSQFYKSACQDKAFFDAISSDTRNSRFAECVYAFCNELANNVSSENALNNVREKMKRSYTMELFNFEWQREQAIDDDVKKIVRFLMWMNNKRIIDSNVGVSVLNDSLTANVSFILEEPTGCKEAVIVRTGSPKMSFGGKSVHTNANNNLFALTSKLALEGQYPGIKVVMYYMTNTDDTPGKVMPLISDRTLKSNIHQYSFDEYYNQGRFDKASMEQKILEVLKTPLIKTCFGCKHSEMCKATPVTNLVTEKVVEENYTLPHYTASQMEAIEAISGPVLILAGPGSGKTATLVGRIKRMIDSGIEPENILAITFTREAADVLLKRCNTFCVDKPYISTIHSLCYQIIRDNFDLIGNEVKLLATKERLEVIKNLLEIYPSLKGFKDGQIGGQNGLLKTIDRKLDKYLNKYSCDAPSFLKEESKLGEDFIEFATTYKDFCSSKGYINFNEQISLCLDLFTRHPEVKDMYSNLFKYILVDEFQDVDEAQARLIYLLAQEKNNLCVVGDDDQSIYGFRGGNNKYMLTFTQKFPSAKVITLRENFRSTEALVDAASSIITLNKNRLQKDLVSGRHNKGVAPIFIDSIDGDRVDEVINLCKGRGVELKDICILSSKNATLETLHSSLKSPSVLDKAFLIRDSLFCIIKDTLSVLLNNLNDDYSFYHLLRMFGCTDIMSHYLSYNGSLIDMVLEELHLPLDITSEQICELNLTDPYRKAIGWLHDSYNLIVNGVGPNFFVQSCAYALGMENSGALPMIQSLIEENSIKTLENLELTMVNMTTLEDDSRVDTSNVNAVHLTTNHDSKGREFKAVILIDDFGKEVTEESRRLLYVAVTRAKDLLFICSDNKSSIVNELRAS